MEITSRQRARLKSIASNYDTIFQIGKNAISDELITVSYTHLDVYKRQMLRYMPHLRER